MTHVEIEITAELVRDLVRTSTPTSPIARFGSARVDGTTNSGGSVTT
jgi:hypothetical protein